MVPNRRLGERGEALNSAPLWKRKKKKQLIIIKYIYLRRESSSTRKPSRFDGKREGGWGKITLSFRAFSLPKKVCAFSRGGGAVSRGEYIRKRLNNPKKGNDLHKGLKSEEGYLLDRAVKGRAHLVSNMKRSVRVSEDIRGKELANKVLFQRGRCGFYLTEGKEKKRANSYCQPQGVVIFFRGRKDCREPLQGGRLKRKGKILRFQ